MNSISAIAKLLLGLGLLAAATAEAGTGSADTRALTMSSSTSQWANESCTVSHQGRYKKGRYRKSGVNYYDFDVSVKSNCQHARLKCLIRYRTLVHQPHDSGSLSATAEGPRWESSLQTVVLEPGKTTETRPLGPTRRNSGAYEIECTNAGLG